MASPYLHVDETSYTVVSDKRTLGWIWVYATKNEVFYDFAESRKKDEFERVIRLDPGGRICNVLLIVIDNCVGLNYLSYSGVV